MQEQAVQLHLLPAPVFLLQRSRRDSQLRDERMECSPPRREAFGDRNYFNNSSRNFSASGSLLSPRYLTAVLRSSTD